MGGFLENAQQHSALNAAEERVWEALELLELQICPGREPYMGSAGVLALGPQQYVHMHVLLPLVVVMSMPLSLSLPE